VVLAQLDKAFPTGESRLDRDLSQLLAYLNSPTVIDKTLALMKKPSPQVKQNLAALLSRNRGYGNTISRMLANHPELQKIHYAFVLRTMRYGWTLDQRREYFKWLGDAGSRSGGASYTGFLNNIRTEALVNVSEAEKKSLASTVVPPAVKLDTLPRPRGPGQAWTVDLVVAAARGGLAGRNFDNGRRSYRAARCGACHRFDGVGGATGPDLSNVAGRFSVKDLAESLIVPGKVVSDQYRASTVVTTAGKVITGRIINDDKGTLTILTDPFDASRITTVPADEVDEATPSKTSLMPEKLLHPLSRDELLDLLAYLLSRGNPDDRVFAE
jgi:putative heme-binding domain-containing protein